MRRKQHDQQSKMFHDLSSLVLNLLESPPTPIDFSDNSPVGSSEEIGTYPPPGIKAKIHEGLRQITPVGFALLLLGISLVLMLCGSVTFFIGFMLMPWVLGFSMVFYVVGLVSNLSLFGRSILCHSSTPFSSPSCKVWFYPMKGDSLNGLCLTLVLPHTETRLSVSRLWPPCPPDLKKVEHRPYGE